MKIRFLNSVCSAEGVFTYRREYEISDDLAAGFIAAGHAEAVAPTEEKSVAEAVVPLTEEEAPAAVDSVEEAVVPPIKAEEAKLPRGARRK